MSYLPSVEDVDKFRKAVVRISESESNIARLKQEIMSREIKLSQYASSLSVANRDMTEALHHMDVASSNNAGWEARIRWFMVELHRQISEEAIKND